MTAANAKKERYEGSRRRDARRNGARMLRNVEQTQQSQLTAASKIRPFVKATAQGRDGTCSARRN